MDKTYIIESKTFLLLINLSGCLQVHSIFQLLKKIYLN